ncbi:MAG TPA: sugar transferase, partial [Vicinamibacteria bacterium]|nr:sugar transferase [Vicinamibacteria bacterium]
MRPAPSESAWAAPPRAAPPVAAAQPRSRRVSRWAFRRQRLRRTLARVSQVTSVRIALLSAVALVSYWAAYQLRAEVTIAGTRNRMPIPAGALEPIWFLGIVGGQLVAQGVASVLGPLRRVAPRTLVWRAWLTAAVAPLPLVLAQYAATRTSFPRSVMAPFFVVDGVLLLVLSLLLRRLESWRRDRVLLLGSWDESPLVKSALMTQARSKRWYSCRLEGSNAAAMDRVERLLSGRPFEAVYLAQAGTPEHFRLWVLELIPESTAVFLAPTTWEGLLAPMHVSTRVGDWALVEIGARLSDPLHAYLKRSLDVLVAAAGLVLLAPLLAALAAVVKANGGRPFFAQRRVGRQGREFTVWKLRTMVTDAEAQSGAVLARRHDARVTALGRWLRALRLDELPQLWNVLRGDMSLVGPRPERPEFVHDHAATIPGYALRHRVRPGITGLAQVLGDYESSAADKLRFDLAYVMNQS